MFAATIKARFGPKFRETIIMGLLMVGIVGICGARALGEPQAPAAQTKAPEAWRKDFEDICSKTEDAMTFSQEELSDLIRRCDALLTQLERLDESRKKVYSGRLRMCRGLYAYVLDSKRQDSRRPDSKENGKK